MRGQVSHLKNHSVPHFAWRSSQGAGADRIPCRESWAEEVRTYLPSHLLCTFSSSGGIGRSPQTGMSTTPGGPGQEWWLESSSPAGSWPWLWASMPPSDAQCPAPSTVHRTVLGELRTHWKMSPRGQSDGGQRPPLLLMQLIRVCGFISAAVTLATLHLDKLIVWWRAGNVAS